MTEIHRTGGAASLIREDNERNVFRVNHAVYSDQAILEQERRAIFEHSWLYVGHESEIRKTGDFVVRQAAGRDLIVVRGEAGQVHVHLNRCTHRAATVCRTRSGSSRTFTCFYHGWTYAPDGQLVGVPDDGAYNEAFQRSDFTLRSPPRVESYRGMIFVSFDPEICGLVDYFGDMREYLDLWLDFADDDLEVAEGSQGYTIKSNWKMLIENTLDGYHIPTVHRRYFRDYLMEEGVDVASLSANGQGLGMAFDNGHTAVEVQNAGNVFSVQAPEELAQIRARLVQKHGAERAARIADYERNIFIFPNLLLISLWRSIRVFHPAATDRMDVNIYALLPRAESEALRELRLSAFVSFLGVGGFGTPDDMAALESCQRAIDASPHDPDWSDVSRGMGKSVPTGSDEQQMRGFWRRWRAMMQGDRRLMACRDLTSRSMAAE